ncbi:pentatricopeptide repeat-containing protein At1g26900, mitochondrial [Nymphaea colorata]|uniref:pentatricopeptide repeat-containing protein At1g26900, mitochondrial n=1 Tax=Nymphaea colorata TaxID=210225 RepID=UPI00129DE71A|nr:pentatricopeptide repeat-containing protein At1g26900, mitochondrial [Nymphaea colorata]
MIQQCSKHPQSAIPLLERCLLLLGCCTQLNQLEQVHGLMVKTSLDQQPFPCSKLLASCSHFPAYARSLFGRISEPNTFMWNTILRSSAISTTPLDALLLLNSMRRSSALADQFTFVCILKACARATAAEAGRCVHGLVLRSGFEDFLPVRNTIIGVYAACGWIEGAHKAFDEIPKRDSVSWNALIGGYVRVGRVQEAFRLFGEMRLSGEIRIAKQSILVLLSGCEGCYGSGSLARGETVHALCVKYSFDSEMSVRTSIIGMYSSNGCLSLARRIFDESVEPDTTAWNCIIGGYVRRGCLQEAMKMYQKMKLTGAKPNYVTMVTLLAGLAQTGLVSGGICIHQDIMEQGLELNAALGTALVDMYGKCGCIEKAVEIFDAMTDKDATTWSAMVSCLALHGRGVDAVALFDVMRQEQVLPNEVTFMAVLTACSHAGLVDQGKMYFDVMAREYDLVPRTEHYGCMVDMLGRAGLLEEAHQLIKSMPMEPDATVWRSLLASCRLHGNVELGGLAKTALLKLEPLHPSDAILMLGAYAAVGRWQDIRRLRDDPVEETRVKKKAGCSSISTVLQ